MYEFSQFYLKLSIYPFGPPLQISSCMYVCMYICILDLSYAFCVCIEALFYLFIFYFEFNEMMFKSMIEIVF